MRFDALMKPFIASDLDRLDETLARDVRAKLFQHYPGWAWAVEIPPGQNVVIIRNLDANPRGQYGLVIHKDKLYGDPYLKKVVMGAGEFLERYRLIRAGWKPGILSGHQMFLAKPEM